MGETEENIILAEREKEKREKEALRKHFILDQVLEIMPEINNFLADQNFSNDPYKYFRGTEENNRGIRYFLKRRVNMADEEEEEIILKEREEKEEEAMYKVLLQAFFFGTKKI